MKIFNYLFVVYLFVCTSCTQNNTLFIKNSYFEELYVGITENNAQNNVYYGTWKESFNADSNTNDVLGFALNSGAKLNFWEQMDFYQDAEHKCLLFSYSREQLAKMKTDSGFSLKDTNTVFSIDRNGGKFLSKKEFIKISHTFVPHSYNSSLCKQKSAND